MLLGSAIGDAAGGPVEFQSSATTSEVLPGCRVWPQHRQLTGADIARLADELRLLPYGRWRPKAEPYGQWCGNAPAGTVTDDTRHKIVVMAAIKAAMADGVTLSRERLARQYDRIGSMSEFARDAYAPLLEESFREYRFAARAVLGEPIGALPPERIWGGLPTCNGQMALCPIAALHVGDPDAAYRHAFELSFFDQGTAKDINSAIIAGLASALDQATDTNVEDSFAAVRKSIVQTDPYRYADIPFIERPVVQCLETAERCVSEADGRPAKLYEALVRALRPKYYWEAHFTFASAWALLKMCRWNGLAAIHLALDMGHDTDSSAQLIGQFWGAISGGAALPSRLREPVEQRLKVDYAVVLQDWLEVLEHSPRINNRHAIEPN